MQRIDRASRPQAGSDGSHFTLPALTQPLLATEDGLPVRMYRVTFGEGARTHWHRHDDVQLLFGLGGACQVVNRAGSRLDLLPGDLVIIQPGEEHWHGSAPGAQGEHLAVNLGERTEWLESAGGE